MVQVNDAAPDAPVEFRAETSTVEVPEIIGVLVTAVEPLPPPKITLTRSCEEVTDAAPSKPPPGVVETMLPVIPPYQSYSQYAPLGLPPWPVSRSPRAPDWFQNASSALLTPSRSN